MFIYKIINIINGKIYIGKTEKTIKERFKAHIKNADKKVNRHLYDAMNHYGIEKFKIETIEKCPSRNILDKREKYWINFYNSCDRNIGYNMQEGGTGGKQNAETLKLIGRKISIANKGRIVTKETRKKISKKHKGMVIPKSVRKKISKTLKKKYLRGELIPRPPPSYRGNKHPMWGKKHSKEAKSKMSKARLGKTYEKLFGKVKAKILKDERKKAFLGKNNPLYVTVDKSILQSLVKNKKTIPEISSILNISQPTVKIKFKDHFGMTVHKYRKLNDIKIGRKSIKHTEKTKNKIRKSILSFFRMRKNENNKIN